MGHGNDYVCTACGERIPYVPGDFDYGFSAVIVTPVLCRTHGVVWAETGLSAHDPGWRHKKRRSYPCSECGTDSPRWDRKTCPRCGERTAVPDPDTVINWD